mmetsp:Transcript_28041/g.43164  ORF Transcript_28041/g.43164 Transcript_28041/m.43164 type:complete len:281 (+) Transcript_28041:49-891(+)
MTTGKENAVVREAKKLASSDPDLKTEQMVIKPTNKVTNQSESSKNSNSFRFVPLRLDGRTHVPSSKSKDLLDEIGGVDGLERMTRIFYSLAFEDKTLDNFIGSHDDPHARRFATWIHQKLGGDGRLWDQNREERSLDPVKLANGQRFVVHDRSSAHAAAWYSPKRPAHEVGRHFKLDECRVWMRLHFWAMRQAGLVEESPSFCDFYVRFIGHFVRVYEQGAPTFARDSFRWSGDPANTTRYLETRRMSDVLGLSLREALRQIPKEEVNDAEWPYIRIPRK